MSEIRERAHADAARLLGTTPGCSTCLTMGGALAYHLDTARLAGDLAMDTITRLTRENEALKRENEALKRENERVLGIHAGEWVGAERYRLLEARATAAEAKLDKLMGVHEQAGRWNREARARITELEEALRKIAALDYSRAATNGAAYDAVRIASSVLTPTTPAPERPCGCGHNTVCDLCQRWTEDGRDVTPAPEQAGEGEHHPACRTITGKVNASYCAECRRSAVEHERGMGEPFCACGRRTSECDDSRAGCRKAITRNGGRDA